MSMFTVIEARTRNICGMIPSDHEHDGLQGAYHERHLVFGRCL
jgi:hypothetical protein